MKKNMFLAAAAVVALASCNNASPKMDEQPAAAVRVLQRVYPHSAEEEHQCP